MTYLPPLLIALPHTLLAAAFGLSALWIHHLLRTYQSAAPLVLKVPSSDTTLSTAKQYWRVRAICTSAGSVLPGSFDLARFPGVYAAAT